MKFPGIHGPSLDQNNESFGHSGLHRLGSGLSSGLSASEFGKLCSKKVFAGRRAVKSWEPSSTSLGCSGLFDSRLGGDCILNTGGAGKRLNRGDKLYRQHANSASSDRIPWFGKSGYRSIGGYEPYRANLAENRVSSSRGPWLLLPSSPSAQRNHANLIEKVPPFKSSHF